MNEDLETSPLLAHQQQPDVDETLNENVAHTKRAVINKGKWFEIFILISILTFCFIFGMYALKNVPSQDVIQQSVLRISNWEVERIHVDGWRDGNGLNYEGGKALQISTTIKFWPEYDEWLADNDTSLAANEKRLYKSISENIINTACLTINNATTYDGVQTRDNVVGTLQVKNRFCINLRNNATTQVNLTLLIEPNMENVLRVLKKLWKHEYEKLNLSSKLDLTLSKQAGPIKKEWGIPLARLRDLKVDWRKLLDWDAIFESLTSLRHQFSQVSVQNFSLRDSVKGFHLDAVAEPFNLSEMFNWIELPENSMIPFISWEIRLPDCKNNFTIALPTVFCFTDSFEVGETVNVAAYSNIEGPLPDSLLSQVCWSDEENAVTPMTNLMNKILNTSELVSVEVKGHAINSKTNLNNSLVPYEILQSFLNSISFFPIATNFTIDSDSLIKEITIDGLRVRWVRGVFGEKRLSVSGTFIGSVALPFYETNKEQISVKYIKGITKLYHQKVHFLTVPMRCWTHATSKIYRDEQDKTTIMELSLSVRDDEVQIINNLELTRILNEILFKGEAPVHLVSKLDLLISSPLGEMVLMGLKGEGRAVMRS